MGRAISRKLSASPFETALTQVKLASPGRFDAIPVDGASASIMNSSKSPGSFVACFVQPVTCALVPRGLFIPLGVLRVHGRRLPFERPLAIMGHASATVPSFPPSLALALACRCPVARLSRRPKWAIPDHSGPFSRNNRCRHVADDRQLRFIHLQPRPVPR